MAGRLGGIGGFGVGGALAIGAVAASWRDALGLTLATGAVSAWRDADGLAMVLGSARGRRVGWTH